MRRYVNVEAIVEGICCLLFSVMIFYQVYSGKYLLFVTPRMKPYLYFTSVIMLFWAVMRFSQIRKPKYKRHLARCLVLAIPLLAMCLPYGTIAASTTQAGYSNVTKQSEAVTVNEREKNEQPGEAKQSGSSSNEAERETKSEEPPSDDSQNSGQELQTVVPSGLDIENQTITVADEEFYQWLVELSYHPEKYEGYTILLHGTIYRDEAMTENEFAITRLVMSCCVADLAPCGPLCLWEGAGELEQDKWVNVTGTYHYDETKGMEIQVVGLEDAQPAEEEYVYPLSY
jgi:putative membrane protein